MAGENRILNGIGTAIKWWIGLTAAAAIAGALGLTVEREEAPPQKKLSERIRDRFSAAKEKTHKSSEERKTRREENKAHKKETEDRAEVSSNQGSQVNWLDRLNYRIAGAPQVIAPDYTITQRTQSTEDELRERKAGKVSILDELKQRQAGTLTLEAEMRALKRDKESSIPQP